MSYSVLMSVYAKERAENLRGAMDSMFSQTVPTDDFVLVCDGELTPELDAVIAEFERAYPKTLHVFRCEKKPIWPQVLNFGLDKCKNELVARMDSDDVSLPDRCEKQLAALDADSELAVVSTGLAEFENDPNEIVSYRILPAGGEELRKFAEMRSPLNHATVIYKKSVILAVGGYDDFPGNEDYQLWVKLLCAGYKLINIPDVLYLARTGEGFYTRRAGKVYYERMRNLRKYMKDVGFISGWKRFWTTTLNGAVILSPPFVKKILYAKIARKKTTEPNK